MSKKIYLIIFTVIVFLGFFLRFYNLGNTPNSLNWDEVSWGYNAYSIARTLNDEHGAFLPLSFKAFGDYKQPVYVYLSVIPVSIFGLEAFSTRFVSAILGSFSILFVWLLVFSIFKDSKRKYLYALISMFFFAVSPWSVQFSRVAFEANVGLFFVISGVSLFLYGINSSKKTISYIGIVLLSISCFSYHSNKIFTPLLFAGLLFYSFTRLNVSKKKVLIFAIVFTLINLVWILDTRTTARGRSVTFASHQTSILETSVIDSQLDEKNNDLSGKILHNRRLVYIDYYLENYLKHFNPNFLFVTGDNARHHTFGMGVLYLVSLPLIIVGIVKLNKRKYWIIWYWLLIAPLASALAVDAPNASRSLVSLPIWQILEALGLAAIISLRHRVTRNILVSVFGIFFFLNFVYFIHNYFDHTNEEYGIYWQKNYREIAIASQKYEKERQVFVSSKLEQPYIFYLFYAKYDPQFYQNSGGSMRISNRCFNIGNVWFGECSQRAVSGDVLITAEKLRNKSLRKLEEIKDRDGNIIGEVNEYR